MDAGFKPVLLVTDVLFLGLIVLGVAGAWWARRQPHLLASWQKVGESRSAMAAATILGVFLVVGVLDSLHYRPRLPDAPGQTEARYGVEVLSVLDAVCAPLRNRMEKTYSAPLDYQLFAKETLEMPDGTQQRDFPRLKFGGAGLAEPARDWATDVATRGAAGLVAGAVLWLFVSVGVITAVARRARMGVAQVVGQIWQGRWPLAWEGVLAVLALVCAFGGVAWGLAGAYHVLGTDKVGQDVLFLTLKSVRTALVIGTITTLVTLPLAIALGLLAGYFGGWVDDVIQYVYTVLNSIPGVLLIAAAVLMMQVVIDTHPDWFATAAERADARLTALCFILGLTSWTGLCRLLRGETLKLRELEYVQAAQAFGVSGGRIMVRHILPNLMHIVMIALVMDFSGLVLAEAVLSYVGIGVDPNTTSFGTMINAARLELAREPMVWWSLASAFVFMFVMVLAANLLADRVRDAFDPRYQGAGPSRRLHREGAR